MFPDPGRAILSQHESAIVLDAAKGTSFFEANVWGLLFYGAHLSVESAGTPGVSLPAFLGYVLFFTRHAGKMLQALGHSGQIEIEVALKPILSVKWLHNAQGHVQAEAGSALDDEFVLQVPTSSEVLSEKPDGVAMEIYRHVFFSVNCPDLVDNPNKLERLVVQGMLITNDLHRKACLHETLFTQLIDGHLLDSTHQTPDKHAGKTRTSFAVPHA